MPFPVDASWIQATESALGVSFPSGFVAKMRRENGGQIRAAQDTWDLYPFRDASDRKRLKRTCNDIVLETRNARDWPDFPPDGIAIGSNGTGDQLILLPDPSAPQNLQPGVFLWDHETGHVGAVADNFLDLVVQRS